MQKKVSTVQLAFSLACCRNVGQLWQRAQCVAGGTGGLWAVPGAGGRQELAGASCFQCWRAAACCSWRSRAPLPGARLQKAKWSFCSWAPSCCYFPLSPGSEEGSLQWAVEQSDCWLCGSAGSCCVASLPSWQVQAPLLSCLDLSLWGHHQSHFPPPSLSFSCRSLHSFWSSERQNIASFNPASTREMKVADGCYSFQFLAQIKEEVFCLNYCPFGLPPVLRLKILVLNTSSLTDCIWKKIYPWCLYMVCIHMLVCGCSGELGTEKGSRAGGSLLSVRGSVGRAQFVLMRLATV